MQLWDPVTWHTTATLTCHTGGVTAMAFSRDGTRLATASEDGTLILWNDAGRECTSLTIEAVFGLAWSGSTIAAGQWGTLTLIDVCDSGEPHRVHG